MRLITLQCLAKGEMTFLADNIIHVQRPAGKDSDPILIGTRDGNYSYVTHLVDRVGGVKTPLTYNFLCDVLKAT